VSVRWYVRVAGTLIEVRRITRPHRTRSLVRVSSTQRPDITWLVEARELIRS
jgi:hypothetical protein